MPADKAKKRGPPLSIAHLASLNREGDEASRSESPCGSHQPTSDAGETGGERAGRQGRYMRGGDIRGGGWKEWLGRTDPMDMKKPNVAAEESMY